MIAVAEVSKNVVTVEGLLKMVVVASEKRQQKLRERREREREKRPNGPRKPKRKVQLAQPREQRGMVLGSCLRMMMMAGWRSWTRGGEGLRLLSIMSWVE